MAASRRSPLMRDQWRAEDDRRDIRPHRDEGERHRKTSPEVSRRRGETEIGLKIRGSARTEAPTHRAADERLFEHGIKPRPRPHTRDRSRSPPRRGREETAGRRRDPSERRKSRDTSRRRGKDEDDLIPRRRKRSWSRSPRGDFHDFRDERKRLGSPYVDRALSPRTRHRERPRSPLRSDYYSSSDRIGDSYVPPGRRRSRSPARHRIREAEPRRRRSRSLGRHSRSREERRTFRQDSPPSRKRLPSSEPRSRKDAEAVSTYRPRPRSPLASKARDPSRSPRRVEHKLKKRHRSRSYERRATSSELFPDKKMQSGRSNGARPIPSFDSSNQNPAFQMHGMKSNDVHGPIPRQVRPPNLNTQHSYNTSPQWTPTSSHHGSPHSGSPYSQGRGGWPAQQQQYHAQQAYSPPYRQNSYPPQSSPQSQFYANGQQSPYGAGAPQMQPGFQNQTYRGNHGSYRGNHYNHTSDRRYSGPGPSPSPIGYGVPGATRGRGGHFQNLQWTANSAKQNRTGGDSSSPGQKPASPDPQFRPQTTNDDEDDNPFRPSKDLQVQDESQKESKMPPPPKDEADGAKGEKVKFAFKTKPAVSVSTKPPPDLSQKMKEPPKKENLFGISKSQPSLRGDYDRGDRRRDRDDRYYRDEYRDNRRADFRDDRRSERDSKRERARERSPEPPKTQKKVMKRMVRRRTLSPESVASSSVYYRKPGNESVVGSGTYGKVFKAIHVYTKNLAALKKIRMDGEKDGFPVTAVREIKLLQSLRHDNVVQLQEVMVENNDCFMVFEYLAHDLTGLLNHPTFKLEQSHKKHLSQQLFEGLNYLHRRGVLHRDIKAANILVSGDGQLKLADFGLARFYNKRGKLDYTNRVITIWYRSPELLLGETQYGPAVDIWSAACVMVEIFTRHAIFPGDGGEINQLDKIYNVLGTPSRAEWPGLVDMAWFELLRPTERKVNTFAEKYQERVTPAAFELLQAMFAYDPSARPTASDVLEHPYFTVEEPPPQQAVE